jgi:serine/threonine-protein kinase
MSRCRKCGQEWGDEFAHCPEDGTTLGGFESDSNVDAVAVGVAATRLSQPQHNPLLEVELTPGRDVGGYIVEKKIGEGGMGVVYGAHHPKIGKRAAIKVLSKQLCSVQVAVDRFVQEARSVNQIRHPNIVDIFAFGELPDGRSYFVMEWLEGDTLSKRLMAGNLNLVEVIEILDEVADALEAAHEKGVVHRDLKPDNVFLVPVRGGRRLVKLLDFGLAKLGGDEPGIVKTRSGIMMGTPAYMSPEQARGKNVDHRTDVYALGAMAFEMVTGRAPYDADTAFDILMQHINGPIPRPSSIWSELPAPLDEIIIKLLAKQPADRPTLADFRAVLAEVHDSYGPQRTPSSRVRRYSTGTPSPDLYTPPPRPSVVVSAPEANATTPPSGEVSTPPLYAPKRKLGWVWAVGAAAVVVGVGGVVLLGGKKPDSTPTQETTAAPAPAPTPPAPVAAPTPAPAPAPTPVATPVAETPPPAAPVAKPGVLSISVSTPARIEVDGKVVAPSGRSARLELPADQPHEVHVTAPGRRPFKQKVRLTAGDTTELPVELARAGGPPPRPTPVAVPPKKETPAPPKKEETPRPCPDCPMDPFRR